MAPTEERNAMVERHEEEYSKLLATQLKAMYAEGYDANSQRWDCFHQAIKLGHRQSRELNALRINRVCEN